MMDGTEVMSVADDGSSGQNHAVVTQAVLDQLQLQQQIQHPHQELLLAAAGNNGANVASAITVQEPQRGIEMIEFFRKQRERGKFCDVVFHVHGKQFYAHRMVLAAGSAYFDSIFKSTKTMRENLAVACREPDIFQVFLNYFYTGSVTLDKNNVGELIKLANHFLVGKLKSYCAEFLERFMDAENCLHIKLLAEKFQLHELVKAATIYVQNNLGEVINHEIMMELPPKQIESFVNEKAWGVPQDAAVKFMSRWVCHDLASRERDFKQLLTNIDWNAMDPNIIVDYIDQEPLYGSSERCFYYVLHSLAEKGIQVQKYEQMYQALQQRFGQELEPALGFGDNLLQMAFNSAMEGLTDSTTLLMSDGRDNNKWLNGNDQLGKSNREERSHRKLSVSLEQRRRRILAKIHRERSTMHWIRLRPAGPKRRRLAYNERLAESSGDEECDPIQTSNGYRCHLCVFVAKKVSRLEKHMSTIHAHDVTYRCSECGFTCKWNREYFLHMKSHYEGPPYKCLTCGYQCQKIGSLISHKVSHVDLKPYQCSECDYKCRNKANLAAHLKTHNNEKPYRCNICGRAFASKNSLDQHAVGHNSEKIYACTQCVFSTKYLNHYTAHKKTHQGIATPTKKGEVYRCHDPQCKYTTSKKSQLDSHMRSHAGVRPHICTICGRRFLEKSHLVRHERIHYNERPFKCEECDYASTRRDKLKEHKTRHHGKNASAKSPYKARPHKSNKQSNFVGDQNVVYAKKSTVQQQQPQAQQSAQATQSHAVQEQASTAVTTGSSGELEFIIPHSRADGSNTTTAFAQLVGGQGGIDLQQIANSGSLVQIRPFQGGKSNEVQLASIPGSISSAELQRTLGVKLEDLQAQGMLGARAIKLEELGVSIQSAGQSVGATVSQGRIQQTMVLTPAQLQQFTQAVAGSGGTATFERGVITPVTSGATVSSAQGTPSSTGSGTNNQTGTEFSGLSNLLYQ